MKNKNNHGEINFNILFVGNNEKIVIVEIEKINIIAIGVFSLKTKTMIIKFFLLSFLISFINYIQNKTDILFNENNNISKNNLYVDIYKSFLFLPFKKYFNFLSRRIFRRQKLKLKNTFYKNYYLIELNSDKIIFSLQSLYNMNSTNGEGCSKYQLEIHKKEQIWNDILYHCHTLKKNYMNKYSSYFNEDNYQQYYAILELKSTFPRRKFLIKFLPILNGLALIHEYIQIKLSSVEGNENTHYRECESIYGFKEEVKSQNEKNFSNDKLIVLKNEPIILKKVNIFFVESFFIKIPSSGLFISDKQKNIYYCKEIMSIIERYEIKEKSLNNINIQKNIEKVLYEEYLKIQSENNEIEINSSNKLINQYYNESFINEGFPNEDNNDKKIELNISKSFILNALYDKINYISKNDDILKNTLSQKFFNISKDIHTNNKIYSNSKKEINKLSEILNDKISDYTGPVNFYNKHKNEDNSNLNSNINSLNVFDNISIKTSNNPDSNILFNRDNSLLKEDVFSIDLSNIQPEGKKPRKYSNIQYNNRSNFERQRNDKKSLKTSFDFFNKISTKKEDSNNSNNSYLEIGLDYLGSKEEFFEGELKNKVK